MALATYRTLCIDAVDAPRLAGFWAPVLGLEAEQRDGEVLLRGESPQQSVWIEQVPEPVTVKQRVHLDVRARSVDDVLALGATALDLESFAWQVLRDPEGGELCVFEPEHLPAYRLYELCVDAADPERIARWWGEMLGATVHQGEGGSWWWIGDVPDLPFEAVVFCAVPEPKTVKNRIHWDVFTPDVDALVAAGARVLRAPDDEITWTVLADPDGNEFCAFPPA